MFKRGWLTVFEFLRSLFVATARRKVLRCPNPTQQTGPTNCFQACVAAVLGVNISDVPAACDGATWDWDVFQDWLLVTHGKQAIEVGFENGGTLYPVRHGVLCIVTGPSPRTCLTGRHAVVAKMLGAEGFELLCDPHPSQAWLNGEPTHVTFFVQVDPAANCATCVRA